MTNIDRPLHPYSLDASHTEGVRTRLGWVLFDNNVVTPLGYWYNIPASLLHNLEAHTSTSWQRAMIKGDSRLPVVGTIALCVQLL